MGSIITLIIIAYFIKKALSQGRGLKGVSDLGRIIGTIAIIIFVISLIQSPVFWILLFIALVALIFFIVKLVADKERAEKYGWNTEEYRQKYSESLRKFKAAYSQARDERGGYYGMNNTQKMASDLDIEKRARESAKAETDAYMRSKYGEPGVPNSQPAVDVSQGAGAAPVYQSNKTSTETKNRRKKDNLKSKILPRSAQRRSKIVKNFSDKYDLYLTDEQVKRIADASYMSVAWKREVEDMAIKYDSVYEWMAGDSDYLRAYLRAFTVQDVTSDFKQQMQIVMDSFEEVFCYSDNFKTLSIDQRIEKINSKYMTNFDEITYMIAYRYLEMLGLHHELDKTSLNSVDGTFDDLISKYENMSTEDIDDDLNKMTRTTQGGQ